MHFTDQLGNRIYLSTTPKRIISVVPSQTELLYTLGLNEEVIGITKFCVHPNDWFQTKTRIGGTKNLNIDKIKSLNPDLIIANKEENLKEQIEELQKHFPVWTSDINDLDTALKMIVSVGEIVSKSSSTNQLALNIESKFSELKMYNSKLKTSYLIWRNPYMTVGGDTFINEMLEKAGLHNVFSNKFRYPEVSLDELKTSNCKIILLSSEPYPFKEKHIEELQQHLPQTKILLVDGEIFSWYGSRLLQAPSYFQQLGDQIRSLN